MNDIIITRQRVLEVLQQHIGAARGASAERLVFEITGDPSLHSASAERVLREIVVSLRLAGHHVCAHPSNGYYIAETVEELDQTCRFLLMRSMTGLQQIAAMKRVSLPDLAGQLRIGL